MKGVRIILLVGAVIVALAGAAAAKELSGVVTAVDVEKSVLTLKTGKLSVSVDCETGSLLKGIKVGDTVTVLYTEEGGRKLATSVTRKAPVQEEAPAPYNPPAY